MRNLILLLTLGLFLTATSANACDGDKASCKGHVKGKKTAMKSCTDAKCMKNGKCTMTKAEMSKAGCCMKGASATSAGASAKSGCDAKASGKHDCCKAKAEGATKS